MRLPLLFALCWAVLGAQAPTNPASPFRGARVGPTRTVSQWTFQVGHASFLFNGRVAPLQGPQGPLGFLAEGEGTLSYQSGFAPEFPLMKRNLADWTKAVQFNEGQAWGVRIPFQKARFWVANLPMPEGGALGGESLHPTADSLQATFAGAQEHEPVHLLAMANRNSSKAPLVVAELTSGSEAWVYQYDGFLHQEETLSYALPDKSGISAFNGFLYLLPMSRQAVGWDPRKGAQLPPYMITALDVDLATPDNRTMRAVVRETLTPVVDGQRMLRFRLFNEVVTREDVRHLKVTRILDEGNRALTFDQSKDFLLVELAEPTRRGSTVTLQFEYEGDFLVHPGEDSYWQLDVNGAWYPQSESLAGELYTFHGLLKIKGDWIGFLPGQEVRRGREGEWNVVEAKADQPICFATVLGGRYYMDEETRDGFTVRIATYGFKPGVGNRVIKDQAFNVVAYYRNLLGPFPFPGLQVIQKNSWGYGQAPAGMMYITNEAFNQMTGLAPLVTQGLRKRFAHEIAHQYWGTQVKMASPEDQWLTESFADYSAAMYEGDFKGESYFKASVASWVGNAKEATAKAPIPLANQVRFRDGRDAFRTRTFLLYDKGPVLLRALHKEMGDKDFRLFLKATQANFKNRLSTTPMVFDLLKFITKRDQAPFLERYFWGLELPKVD